VVLAVGEGGTGVEEAFARFAMALEEAGSLRIRTTIK
jgi:hypothetical protein